MILDVVGADLSLFSTLQIHTLCPISIKVWLCIWEANLSMFLFMIASRKLHLLEWKHFKQWEIGSLWPIWHSYWVNSPNTLANWCDKTVAKMFAVRKNMICFHACCCFVLKIFLIKVFLDAERGGLILITAFFSCCYKENPFFIFLFICWSEIFYTFNFCLTVSPEIKQ